MRILGVDPGTESSGWVVYDSDRHEITAKGDTPNDHMLKWLKNGLFDVMAIEMIASYGMPVGATTFETCVWIGRFVQVVGDAGVKVECLYRTTDIKPTICGSNRATDANIRQSLIDMFPPIGGGKTPQIGVKNKQGRLYGMKTHKWSALAVAMTYALKNKIIERPNYSL